jgi:uncharacterized membrane protein (DUF2068 family)
MEASGRAALRTIAAFEAAKGLLALAAGFGLLALLPHGWRATAHELTGHLHLNAAKRVPHVFLQLADNLADLRLWVVATLALAYATARLAEAYGLWRERRWAKWLAATSGAIYVPFELYELTRGVSAIKLAMLALNVAIVLYMVAALRRRVGRIL